MSETQTQPEGKALKKLLMMGRKQVMNFAFAPGTSDPRHFLVIDRRRAPEILARTAKKAIGANKIAYGTYEVDDRAIRLTCERLVEDLAKKFRKHLKDSKAPMSVIVLDAHGTEIDSAIVPRAGDDEAAEDVVDDPEEDAPEAPPALSDALLARLDALEPQIAETQGAVGDKLKAGLAKAEAAAAAGDADAVEKTVATLEAALSKIAAASQTAQTAQAAAPAAAAPGPLDDKLAALRDTVAAVNGPAADKLAAGLDGAAKMLAAGKTAQAEKTLATIEAALAKLGGPADAAPIAASGKAWAKTRTGIFKDMVRLKSAIDSTMGGPASAAIAPYFRPFDDRLETTLAALATATGPAQSDKLRKTATALVADLRSTLDEPFFRDVDTNNGFTKVSIRAPALRALDQVSAALS